MHFTGVHNLRRPPIPRPSPAARHLALNLCPTAQSLCHLGQVTDPSEPQFSHMENGDKIAPNSWVCWEAKVCNYRQRGGTMPGSWSGLVWMFAVIVQLPWGGLPATRLGQCRSPYGTACEFLLRGSSLASCVLVLAAPINFSSCCGNNILHGLIPSSSKKLRQCFIPLGIMSTPHTL